MTYEDLNRKGAVMVPDLGYGFAHYPYELLRGTPACLREFLLNQIKRNGWEHSFVDFYYGELTKEEQDNVGALLEEEQRQYLSRLDPHKGALYYPLSPELFEITFLLSIREGLFSTFYFTNQPCTVWSNYNQRFVVFYPPGTDI